MAIMDWASRRVLAWRVPNTLDASFCIEALEEAVIRYGVPEIFNSDQGSQFTSEAFTGILDPNGIKISMDGRETSNGTMGNSDSLADPMKLRSPLYPPVAVLYSICKGLPCYHLWLPLRVDPDTPGGHPSVMAVIVRIDVSAFLFLSWSRQLQFIPYEATYRFTFVTTRRFACPT